MSGELLLSWEKSENCIYARINYVCVCERVCAGGHMYIFIYVTGTRMQVNCLLDLISYFPYFSSPLFFSVFDVECFLFNTCAELCVDGWLCVCPSVTYYCWYQHYMPFSVNMFIGHNTILLLYWFGSWDVHNRIFQYIYIVRTYNAHSIKGTRIFFVFASFFLASEPPSTSGLHYCICGVCMMKSTQFAGSLNPIYILLCVRVPFVSVCLNVLYTIYEFTLVCIRYISWI